ncbi:MAG TPA: ABC transporter permease [Candidatus Dormibacteraeota bacterium]|nr:ABC transporter permease [Candidatus Dormibacteraeota bacterium]
MSGQPFIDVGWIGDHVGLIWERFLQHLELTVIPVALGFTLSLVIAILVLNRSSAYGAVIAISGVLYTIPSLAAYLLVAQFTGLTLLTAVIPLTTYTLLILIRAIVAGFRAVPAEVLEAAEGMGYTARQRLLRVQLPLAVPLMIAGIRLATVTTIGLATVAAILGDTFGGFGQFLTEGLQTLFPTKIYLGAGLSVAFAIAADILLVRVERWATPWSRARVAR